MPQPPARKSQKSRAPVANPAPALPNDAFTKFDPGGRLLGIFQCLSMRFTPCRSHEGRQAGYIELFRFLNAE